MKQNEKRNYEKPRMTAFSFTAESHLLTESISAFSAMEDSTTNPITIITPSEESIWD